MVNITHHVQTRTQQTEINSHILDAFLKNCTVTTPPHLIPANSIPSRTSNPTILALPLPTMKKILRNLLTSPSPLILNHDPVTPSHQHRTHLHPNILQVSKAFHDLGLPILYGENTLTTSSPSTSFDFDKHLFSLPGSNRQLVTHVKLEIDWAERLWVKFPLVARALGELKGLARLEIVIVERERGKGDWTKVIGEDAGLEILISYGHHHRALWGDVNGAACQRPSTINIADRRAQKKGGVVAAAMLQAEMNSLADLVTGIKGLKYFRLSGFRHRGFARCLEEYVHVRASG